MWYEKKPVWMRLLPDCERQKLNKKAKKLRFVGYCKSSKGHRLYDEGTWKLVKSRDVIFNETDFVVKMSVAEGRKKEAVDVEPGPTPVEENTGQSNEAEDSAQQLDEPRQLQRDLSGMGMTNSLTWQELIMRSMQCV